MTITVVLCTHNRCEDLRQALGSVGLSRVSESTNWEVLVVDNNSTDETRGVTEDYARRYPGRFRYVFEPNPGKSSALNTAIREARGDVLAFMDDDVTVDPAWLENLTACLASGDWAGAGGRTLPAGPLSPPRWLALNGPHSLGAVLFASFDLGEEPRELDLPPYGANMAFRKAMFERYGGFRTDLGPSPNGDTPRPNEDTEFGRRLMAAGERLRYEPSAVAYHPIRQDRIKKEYFLSWYFDYGRARMREAAKRPGLWKIPREYFRILKSVVITLPARMASWLLNVSPADRFFCKCWVWMTAGEIVESYRQTRGVAR